MTPLEQQLTSALEQLQRDYEQQFTEIGDQLNELASMLNQGGDTGKNSAVTISESLSIQEKDKACLKCSHAMFSRNSRDEGQKWDFECLISRRTKTVPECTQMSE